MKINEGENRSDCIDGLWWKSTPKSGDYTKYRTGALGYTMDDLIGRRDASKFQLVTSDPTTTASGAGNLIT